MSLLDHANRPEKRQKALTFSTMAGGFLIHDQLSDAVHILRPETMTVWRLSNGMRTADEIAERTHLAPAMVRAALYALATADLMLDSDIIVAVYRENAPDSGNEPPLQTHQAGSAWLAGYRQALADGEPTQSSAGGSRGYPGDGTVEAW
jgi:hypothetical protein